MGTVSPNKGYQLPTVGGDPGPQFANEINATIGIIDSNMGGTNSQSVAGNANVILTATQAQSAIQVFTGILTGNIIVEFPAGVGGFWAIENNTTGNFLLTVATTALSASVVVAPGAPMWVFSDGTNIGAASPKGWQQLGFVNLAGAAGSPLIPLPNTFFRRYRLTMQGVVTNVANGASYLHWYNGSTPVVASYVEVAMATTNTGQFTHYLAAQTAVGLTVTQPVSGSIADAEASLIPAAGVSLAKVHNFGVNTTPAWQIGIVDNAVGTPTQPDGFAVFMTPGTFVAGTLLLEGYPL